MIEAPAPIPRAVQKGRSSLLSSVLVDCVGGNGAGVSAAGAANDEVVG